MSIKVTVWNENLHEQKSEKVREIYPEGIHGAIAGALRAEGISVNTATLDMPEHGLTEEILGATDVLVWWGHMGHHLVNDAIVKRVQQRVLDGMGLIVLHSGHASKIFQALMGTNTDRLRWRESGDLERLWVIDRTHPIADGVGEFIEIEHEETYGEHFDIPAPDELVFISWFSGGEVFRSGCCFKRGMGKIFYFKPGHETFPIYHDSRIQRVISNAVKWAAPRQGLPIGYVTGHTREPLN